MFFFFSFSKQIVTLLLAASCSASLYGHAVSSQYHTQDNHGQYSYGYADPNSQKHESRSADGVTHGGYSYVDGNGLVQSVKYTADHVNGFQVAATNLPVGPAPVHPVAHYAHAAPVAHYAHAAPVVYAAHHVAAPAISYAHHVSAPAVSYAHVSAPVAHYAAPWGYAAHANGAPHDTPEVHAAKIAHFAAHAEARAAHHLHKRSAHWGGSAYANTWAHAASPVQIHNGVPVDTPEVQHAKAAHFAAHAAANHAVAIAPVHYAAAPAYHHAAPAHYAHAVPVIHNGVPVDTPEVQHAKAAHFAAVAEAQSRAHSAPAHYAPAHYAPAPAHHSGAYHIPVIHNGVPVETPEVQHAKAAHFAAVAEAQGRSAHYDHHDSWSDNSWDNHGHHDW